MEVTLLLSLSQPVTEHHRVLIQDYSMRWGTPLTGNCDSETTHWPTGSFFRTALQSETFLWNPLGFLSPSQVPAWHCGQRPFPPSPSPSLLSFTHISLQYISCSSDSILTSALGGPKKHKHQMWRTEAGACWCGWGSSWPAWQEKS